MADHYLGLNRGAVSLREDAITAGTSSGSTDVELRIADAAGWTRHEIILALKVMAARLEHPNVITDTLFPPG